MPLCVAGRAACLRAGTLLKARRRGTLGLVTTAALVAAAVVAVGAPATAKIVPQLAVRDGRVAITAHASGTVVEARLLGGLASGGRWFGWVPLRASGTQSEWGTILRAPGFYGVYPVQLRVDGKITTVAPAVKVLPHHFAAIPGYWAVVDVVDAWAKSQQTKVLSSSTWHSGFFTHRVASLNRLIRVRTPVENVYLNVARLTVDGPWRLIQIVKAP